MQSRLTFHTLQRMDPNLHSRMVAIDFVDDPMPGGCSHTLALRIWTSPRTPEHEVTPSAQVLALGFLEKATAALRKQVLLDPVTSLPELSVTFRSGREQQTSPIIKLVE